LYHEHALYLNVCSTKNHLIYSKIVVKYQDHFAEDIAWLPETENEACILREVTDGLLRREI
jgi:hypothetical protein